MFVTRRTYDALQAQYRREVARREETQEELDEVVRGAARVSQKLEEAEAEIARLHAKMTAEGIPLPAPVLAGEPLYEGGYTGRPQSLVAQLHRERQARGRQEAQLLAAEERIRQLEATLAKQGVSAPGAAGAPAPKETAADNKTAGDLAVQTPGVAAC